MMTDSPVDGRAAGRPDLQRVVGISGQSSCAMYSSPARVQALEQADRGVDDVDAAPSPSSSRSASSIVYWTTAPGSRAPEIRVPSSRSDRSMSAWRDSVDSERASSLDQPGVGHRERGVVGERTDERDLRRASKASAAVENVPSAPNTSSPAVSGATTIDRMPISSTNWSGRRGVDEPLVGRVVAGDDDRAGRRPPSPNMPVPSRELERARSGGPGRARGSRAMA